MNRKLLPALLLVCLSLCLLGTALADGEGDTRASALSIEIGSKATYALDQAGDIDFFTFTTTDTPSYYNIDITNKDIPLQSVSGLELSCALLPADDDEPIQEVFAYLDKDATKQISQKLLPNTTYYIKVQMPERFADYIGSYQLALEAIPDEAGNTMADALDVELETKGNYALDGLGDIDYLRFMTTDTPSYYNIEVTNKDIPVESVSNFDLVCGLYDADDELIEEIFMHDGKDATKMISQKLATGTAYYLRIAMPERFAKYTGAYQVTINVAPDEAGNTPAEALDIALETKGSYTLDGTGDVDYLRFETTGTPSYYNIEVTNKDIPVESVSNFDLVCGLYDADDELIEEIFMHDGKDATKMISQKLETGTVYYLRIAMPERFAKYTGAYQVTVNVAPDEAGNTPAEALDIDLDTKGAYTLDGTGDVDYLRFTTTATPSYYNIEVTNKDVPVESVSNFDLVCGLYDEDDELIDEIYMHDGEDATKMISQKLETGTAYYLRIAMPERFAKFIGAYEVSVTPKVDDAGNTAADALPLTVGETGKFAIDGRGDVDCFAFTTAEEAFYNINIANVDIPVNRSYGEYHYLTAKLYDAGESLIAEAQLDNESRGNFSLSQKLPADTAYTLHIGMDEQGGPWSLGQYEVTITASADDVGDTKETATSLTPGEATAAVMNGAGDVDCFTFTISGPSAICGIELTNDDIMLYNSGQLVAIITGSDGSRVAQVGATMDRTSYQTFTPVEGATYDVRVEMTDVMAAAPGTYTLRLCADGAHFPADVWIDAKDATCTEDGLRYRECTLCRAHAEEEVLPATGHAFSEWAVTREATKEEEGEESRTCANCGEVETKPIEMLPKGFFEKLFGG